jgi:O-antigen ligase
VLNATLDTPIRAVFYLLKLTEYAIAFYIAYFTVDTEDKFKKITHTFMLTALAVAIIGFIEWINYCFSQQFLTWRPFRIFDNPIYKGQSNHIAGFLIIAINLALSDALIRKSSFTNIARALSVAIISWFTLMLTLSRIAMIATFITVAMLIILHRSKLHKKILLALVITIASTIGFVFYRPIQLRFADTFGWEYQAFQSTLARTEVGYTPEFSYTRNRFENWYIAISELKLSPIFGCGLGARNRAFYENQYIAIMSETGILGLGCFLSILIVNLINLRKRYGKIGVLTSFIGVILLGITSISFTISKISGPIWLLTGSAFCNGKHR